MMAFLLGIFAVIALAGGAYQAALMWAILSVAAASFRS
jgi:hypothetical protein